MVKQTEENMYRLAEKVFDEMDHDGISEYIINHLQKYYRENPEEFKEDWDYQGLEAPATDDNLYELNMDDLKKYVKENEIELDDLDTLYDWLYHTSMINLFQEASQYYFKYWIGEYLSGREKGIVISELMKNQKKLDKARRMRDNATIPD